MVLLGQRKTMMLALPMGAILWLVLALAPSVRVLQVVRVAHGMVLGLYLGPSINYVLEIAHTSARGRLSALIHVGRQLGFLFIYTVGSSGIHWRHTSIVCGCVTVIPFIILCFIRDSPRWLATKSRMEDAQKSIEFFRGKKYPAEDELRDIQVQLETSSGGTSSVLDQIKLFKEPAVAKIIILFVFLFYIYQQTGNFAMIVYSTTIFHSVDSSIDAYLSTIIIGCVRVFATMVYLLISDKISRKIIIFGSFTLSSIFMAILAAYSFASNYGYDVSSFDFVPLVSLALFIFFTCSSQSSLFLIRGELMPTSVRSLGVALTNVVLFLGAFTISFSFTPMVSSIGTHGAFTVFAVNGLLMLILTSIFVPETRSKSLEDIQKELVNTKNTSKAETNGRV